MTTREHSCRRSDPLVVWACRFCSQSDRKPTRRPSEEVGEAEVELVASRSCFASFANTDRRDIQSSRMEGFDSMDRWTLPRSPGKCPAREGCASGTPQRETNGRGSRRLTQLALFAVSVQRLAG